MKHLVILFCILLVSCVEEITLISASANGSSYSYNYIDAPAGSDVIIDGFSYKVFKVPAYDALSGALYHVKLLSTETIESMNIKFMAKSKIGHVFADTENSDTVSISGRDSLVVKSCGYDIASTSRRSYCYSTIFLEIGSMVLEIEGAYRESSQSITPMDYDYTDEADQLIYNPYDIDAITDEMIDYIQVNEVIP
jgi:hypothetical protein